MPVFSLSRSGRRAIAIACGVTLALPAAAAAAERPALALSGFGTLGEVHASERNADFSNSVIKASGAGYSRVWSPNVDSRLGVQLDATLGAWSGVLQVVSEQNMEGSYRPAVEWANIKYQATPDLALRAGRIALPLFLGADYRKVGYAYPWVRPPVEVYGSLPITSSDGGDLTWRFSTGALRHATQVFVGQDKRTLAPGVHIEAQRIAGFSHTIESGPLTARLATLTTTLTLDVAQALFDRLATTGPNGAELAQRYAVDHKRATLSSFGVSYDPGRWFVTAEAGHTHSNSFLGKTSTMYAGCGLRIGAFTPFAGYARVHADSPTSDPGLPVPSGPTSHAAIVGALNGMLNASLNDLLATVPAQSTFSAGVRWDLRTNVALKAQFDRVRPRDGSRGTLINAQPGFESGHPLQVESLALDFVF